MTTTRQRIMAYLKKQRAAAAGQIARALNLSAANVRHHLSVLQAEERVAEVGRMPGPGRGRPLKLYALSPNMQEDNLALLLDRVLTLWLGKLSPRPKHQALQELGRLLVVPEAEASAHLSKRVSKVVARLNDLHYQAHWEAGAEGPRLLFGHCPYVAIIETHPELCRMDEALLGSALGHAIRTAKRAEASLKGMCPYVFTVLLREEGLTLPRPPHGR